jgi:hypothetical protein
VVVVVVMVVPGRAHADDKARARAIAADGIELARAGAREGNTAKVETAIAKFKQAFALDPDPEYRCAIGIAYRGMGKLARAHLFFGRCVARIADAERKGRVRRVIESIESKLRASGHVPVDVVTRPANATVRVSHFARDERFPAPWQIWLPPGRHTLTATATGFVEGKQSLTIARGGGARSVLITLDKEPAPKAVAEPSAPAPAGHLDTGHGGPVDTPARKRGLTPWLLIGTGGAAAIVGGIFHVVAFRNIRDLDGLTGSVRKEKVSTIEKERAGAIGGYVVGAIAAGVGTYLLLRSRRKGKSRSLSWTPVNGGGSMVWLTVRR